jgi:DnaJ-class molecular chaperone
MAFRRHFHDDGIRAVREPAFGVAAPSDCFADEIAIDFPSVGRFLERARDAFLGGRADVDTLRTEVSLSTRDAFTGTTVPLEVPIRGTCALCGGRGETWMDPCNACCGTGDWLVHQPVQLSVPPRVADGARLRFRVSLPHAAPLCVEIRVAIRSSAA